MKGICHVWSRGRHFFPSLPGDRYRNLGFKSDHWAEISGNIVGYDALAPRPEVLRLISCFYANLVLSFSFHYASVSSPELIRKGIHIYMMLWSRQLFIPSISFAIYQEYLQTFAFPQTLVIIVIIK